ncbi:hypothetical protein [Neptunomonas phycophila]|uniref:hypothetical protein n=1 Tax=Neptunomonas phycophila TaxID=1572645 RepID=UPI0011153BE7|nr:hypothetical protein [Neptunomonas phycophila]
MLVFFLFSAGVLLSDYVSTGYGDEKYNIDIFDEMYDDYIYIYDFKKFVDIEWVKHKEMNVDVYASVEDLYQDLYNSHRKMNLSHKISKLLFFYLFPVYCLLFFLFYPKMHPIVVNRSKGIIYTVRRGQVYLYKVGKVEERQTELIHKDGEPVLTYKSMGCTTLWLDSIKTGRRKKFYAGYYPPSPFMAGDIFFKICAALMDNHIFPDKDLPLEDKWKPIRWLFEISLYPSFLHKKVDHPTYLAQIEAYLDAHPKC